MTAHFKSTHLLPPILTAKIVFPWRSFIFLVVHFAKHPLFYLQVIPYKIHIILVFIQILMFDSNIEIDIWISDDLIFWVPMGIIYQF